MDICYWNANFEQQIGGFTSALRLIKARWINKDEQICGPKCTATKNSSWAYEDAETSKGSYKVAATPAR